MMEIKGTVHFSISVSDTSTSERFYCDVLGMEMVQRVPSLGMVFLKAGSDFVILVASKTPIKPNPGNEILVHHAFRVDAARYDQCVADLRANNVEILFEEERHTGIFQGRQAYFHDPDRNVIEIIGLEQIGKGVDENTPGYDPFTHAPPT